MLKLATLNAWMRGNAGGSQRSAYVMRDYAPAHAAVTSYDQALLWISVALLTFGLVMVYSASVALGDSPRYHNMKPTFS